MTFTNEEISEMDVDINDDWQCPDEGSTICNVMVLISDELEKRICKFFGYDYEKDMPDGWVDCYAKIDVVETTVKSMLFYVITNNDDIYDRELILEISNIPEQRAIYEQLAKESKLKRFVEMCRKDLK